LEKVEQRLVTSACAERPVTLNLFLSFHLPNQPVKAYLCGIGSVKTRHITQSVLLSIWGCIGAEALQKTRERLIGPVVIHSLQNFLDFREKVARRKTAVLDAPIFPIYFTDRNFALPECVHNFRGTAVDELRSQFNGKWLFEVIQCEDSATDAIAGLEDDDRQTYLGQLRGCHQPGGTRAYYDHIDMIRLPEFIVSTEYL
jgi:hypothetical protein